jgi:hypothetical protein
MRNILGIPANNYVLKVHSTYQHQAIHIFIRIPNRVHQRELLLRYTDFVSGIERDKYIQ